MDGRLNVRTQDIEVQVPAVVEEAILQTAAATTATQLAVAPMLPILTDVGAGVTSIAAGLTAVETTIESQTTTIAATIENASNAVLLGITKQTTELIGAVETAAGEVDLAIAAQTGALEAGLTAVTGAVGALAVDIDTAASTCAAASTAAGAAVAAGIVGQTTMLTVSDSIPLTANLYSVWNKLDTIHGQVSLMQNAFYTEPLSQKQAIRVAGPEAGWNLPPIHTDTVIPTHVDVSGTVSVSNFPTTQTVTGSVAVSNLPAVQQVAVTNFPASTAVTGTVSVDNFPGVQKIQLPDRQFLPVVNFTAGFESSSKDNYWMNCIPAWPSVGADYPTIIMDAGQVSNVDRFVIPQSDSEHAYRVKAGTRDFHSDNRVTLGVSSAAQPYNHFDLWSSQNRRVVVLTGATLHNASSGSYFNCLDISQHIST